MAIYRDLDQATLDRLYNPRLHTPSAPDTIARYTARSRDVAARLRCVRDLFYGDDPKERLDLVLPAAATAFVMSFAGAATVNAIPKAYIRPMVLVLLIVMAIMMPIIDMKENDDEVYRAAEELGIDLSRREPSSVEEL